jgi:hypothetical protein
MHTPSPPSKGSVWCMLPLKCCLVLKGFKEQQSNLLNSIASHLESQHVNMGRLAQVHALKWYLPTRTLL